MSVINLLEQIKNEEIVLPAIQRDFVWDKEKTEKLLDSIMRGYPIGIILLWETYNDIQYRVFVKDYQSDTLHIFHDNKQQRRLKLVLDGQQRLQSLYTALYGTYEGKYLYFDILSGRETEDFKEDKYIFNFYSQKEAEERNKEIISKCQKANDEKGEDFEKEYHVKIQELYNFGVTDQRKFRRDIAKKLNLFEADDSRLETNLSVLNHALTKDENILKTSILDENKPHGSSDRKSESDVLEAFVRINREGTSLSRSDLIFSMLKLNWKESAETLPEFVHSINDGNSFELDSDFTIRCLFAVSNLGTKFDIDLLRKRSNVEKIQNNFKQCCDAIRSLVDFVQSECWISSSKLLGGYYNLVPFVYYLFHTKNHQVSNCQIDSVRKGIYMFGFTSPFSRYADSRLGKFIREELKPLAEQNSDIFPLNRCVWWVWYWERKESGAQLLQGNPSLTLHLVQRRSGAKIHYDKNAPQVDHIFPSSTLREKGHDEALVNHFANFWILAKNKNQNKSSKPPKKYFEDVDDGILQRACIDRSLLDYRHYKTFLKDREAKILRHIEKELKLKLSDPDFNILRLAICPSPKKVDTELSMVIQA